MQNNPDLEKAALALVMEMYRFKGISDGIKSQVKRKKINRLECKQFLFDIRTCLFNINNFTDQLLPAIPEDKKPAIPAFKQILLNMISQVEDYATKIDDIKNINDTKMRNDVLLMVSNIEFMITAFQTGASANTMGITGMAKILQFVSSKPMGLDENWLAASCYLSSIDILVNRKRKDLKIAKSDEEEKKISFYDKFDELIKHFETKNIEVSKLLKQLPKVFWIIRIDVIHYGYVPQPEELDLIIVWSKNILDMLSK